MRHTSSRVRSSSRPAAAAVHVSVLKLSSCSASSSRLQSTASAAASAGPAARAARRCWAASRDWVMAAYWAVTAAPRDACTNRAAAWGRSILPSSSASAPAMLL